MHLVISKFLNFSLDLLFLIIKIKFLEFIIFEFLCFFLDSWILKFSTPYIFLDTWNIKNLIYKFLFSRIILKRNIP